MSIGRKNRTTAESIVTTSDRRAATVGNSGENGYFIPIFFSVVDLEGRNLAMPDPWREIALVECRALGDEMRLRMGHRITLPAASLSVNGLARAASHDSDRQLVEYVADNIETSLSGVQPRLWDGLRAVSRFRGIRPVPGSMMLVTIAPTSAASARVGNARHPCSGGARYW
jgi:hypothetical protein